MPLHAPEAHPEFDVSPSFVRSGSRQSGTEIPTKPTKAPQRRCSLDGTPIMEAFPGRGSVTSGESARPMSAMTSISGVLPRNRMRGSGRYARTAVRELRDLMLGTATGMFWALAVVGFVLLFLGAAFWSLVGGNEEFSTSFNDSFWISWGLFFDPGTQTGIPASDPLQVRLIAVLFSIFGFIFNLTLLGTVVEGVRTRMYRYRQKYSRVSTRGHVLVLGWGDKTLPLLCELLASEAKSRERMSWGRRLCCGRFRSPHVVILAERPVAEMEQKVKMHFHFEDMSPHNISFRKGCPTDRTELLKVSAPKAEDILIMSSAACARESDMNIMQIIMALGALPGDRQLSADIFAEVMSEQNVRVLRTILPSAEGVLSRRHVGRILVLRTLVPSVGFVFLDTGSFRRGNSFHLVRCPPGLAGHKFRDASAFLPKAVLCGIKPLPGEVPEDGEHPIIVDGERTLDTDDVLLIMARNRQDATGVQERRITKPRQIPKPRIDPPLMQRDGQVLLGPTAAGRRTVLVLGVSQDLPAILHNFDQHMAEGSEVHVLSTKPVKQREDVLRHYFASRRPKPCPTNCAEFFDRITVVHRVGDYRIEYELQELPIARADCALILAEQHDDEEPTAADTRNLAAVIALRAVLSDSARTKRCKIVTELLDPKSQQVLDRNNSVRALGSFIYSNTMATGVFAMAAAERRTFNVWRHLLSPNCEYQVAAAAAKDFISASEELSFDDFRERVWDMCGGILLGWRRAEDRYPKLNPRDKSEPHFWSDSRGDELIMMRSPPPLRAGSEDGGEAESVAPEAESTGSWTGARPDFRLPNVP